MRTDPRAACANASERLGWAVVHDLLAHPMMALTNWASWAVAFHNWTSARAWPRKVTPTPQQLVPEPGKSRYGLLQVIEVAPGIWRVRHPRVGHSITLQSPGCDAACEKALEWFDSLAIEFGGAFGVPQEATA